MVFPAVGFALAAFAVSYVLQRALAPSSPDPASGVARKVKTTSDPEAPRETVYGEQVKGAHVAWAGVAGNNDQFTGVDYIVAAHPCQQLIAIQVGEYTLPIVTSNAGDSNYEGLGLILESDRSPDPANDTMPSSGMGSWYVPVNGSPWLRHNAAIKEARDVSHIYVRWRPGDQTVTDPVMADIFRKGDRNYGDVARKFIGLTVAHVIFRVHPELPTMDGALPQVKFWVKGKNNIALNDSGSSTGYTNLAALCLADWMKVQFGVLPANILNHSGGGLSSLSAECADTSWHSSGTAGPRFEFNHTLRDDIDPVEGCDLIASHMLGGYSQRGPNVVFWTGTIKSSVLALNQDHFMGPLTLTNPSEDQWVNTLVPHFVPIKVRDENSQFQLYGEMKPTNTYATASAYVTADGNEVLKRDYKLEGCIRSRNAMFMAKCELDTIRLGAQYTRRFSVRACVLDPGDVITINDPEVYPGATKHRVMKVTGPDPDDWSVEIVAQRYEDAIYTAALVSEDAVGTLSRRFSGILGKLTGLSVGQANFHVSPEGKIIFDLLVSWTGTQRLNVIAGGHVRIQWRPAVDAWPGHSKLADGSNLQQILGGFKDGITYTFRARFEGTPSAGRMNKPIGEWSNELDFTPSLAGTGVFAPGGPPLAVYGDGSNALRDPRFKHDYDSNISSGGATIDSYLLTNSDGGGTTPTGRVRVITGDGYWAVDRNDTDTETCLEMTATGDEFDNVRVMLKDRVPVRPGQIWLVGATTKWVTSGGGKIRYELRLLRSDGTTITTAVVPVLGTQRTASRSTGVWYHLFAPYQIQPTNGEDPAFIRFLPRMIRTTGTPSVAQTIRIDGACLAKINEATWPSNPDDVRVVSGLTFGSNYVYLISFGLPKTPQGGPFWADNGMRIRFEFTCDVRVEVAITTTLNNRESWAEFRLRLVEGTYPHWGQSTHYDVGDRVRNSGPTSANELIYQCDVAGTSAGSGADGPTGTGTNIVDGSARWDYVRDGIEQVISTQPSKQYARLTTDAGDTTALKSLWSHVELVSTITFGAAYTNPAATPYSVGEGFWIVRAEVRHTPGANGGDPGKMQIRARDYKLHYRILEENVSATDT